MRLPSLIITLLFFGFDLTAQHNNEFYNNGALVAITATADVYVAGDVHMRGATGSIINNGLLKLDGHMYGDHLFQQTGTGTTRLQNNLTNIGQVQKISGSYAVRGTGSANIGVNDGSFYNLELANDQGIVWLETNAIAGSTPYVADVRNSVDFIVGGIQNRIITADPSALPANGSTYPAVFGLMNSTAGLASLIDNTVTLNGNSSAIDAGYIQGKYRRRIAPAGGTYGYVVGLEPTAAGPTKRGLQYMAISLAANTYDVLETYFQSALSNALPIQVECTSYSINYWGGADHGQWVIGNPNAGAGTYNMQVWCQNDAFPAETVWLITKDNAISGTANQCGPSPVGLTRNAFSGISNSTFGVAASTLDVLPTELMKIWTDSKETLIQVNWNIASEHNVSHYNLQRSENGIDFILVSTLNASGNSISALHYSYDDANVARNKDYYYRYQVFDFDGTNSFSPIVLGRLNGESVNFTSESVTIYPNPSSDNLNIVISSSKEREMNIEIYNAFGQILHKQNYTINEGNSVLPILVESWATGMYTVKMIDINSEETVWNKFIKQ